MENPGKLYGVGVGPGDPELLTIKAVRVIKEADIIFTAAQLKKGKKVVFLTLGDPVTYSTFGYILKKMDCIMPEADIETIPGITSFHAASARLNRILVEGEESLLVTSGAFGGEQIRHNNGVENVAIVKAYKNIKDINNALKETGFDNKAVAVSKCGRKNERIVKNIDELERKEPDYWTLILASK